MTLRMLLAVILAVNTSTAIASPLCYSVNSAEYFAHLEPKLGGFKLEVQRLGYCAVLLVASARVNARAKV